MLNKGVQPLNIVGQASHIEDWIGTVTHYFSIIKINQFASFLYITFVQQFSFGNKLYSKKIIHGTLFYFQCIKNKKMFYKKWYSLVSPVENLVFHHLFAFREIILIIEFCVFYYYLMKKGPKIRILHFFNRYIFFFFIYYFLHE